MKDILLVVSLLLVVGLSILTLHYHEKNVKASKGYDEERYSRMVAEESLQKSAARAATLEAQLKSADAKINKVQDVLDQQQGVNSDLKKQYEQLTQSKAEIESKLKATLEAEQQKAAEQAAQAQQASTQPVVNAATAQ